MLFALPSSLQASSLKNVLERFLSTKFLLTLASLAGVFVLKVMGKSVDDLEVVLPAILAFYMGGNVMQSAVDRGKLPFRRAHKQEFPPPQEQEIQDGSNHYPSRRNYGG